MRYFTRCRSCRTRRVLPRHPEAYAIVPQCRVCGKRYHEFRNGVRAPIFFIDKERTERVKRNRANGCMCPGYAWGGNMSGAMHRRGSKQCWYRENGERREPGDADYFMNYREGEDCDCLLCDGLPA
jgi:hypothetical protein